MEGPHAGSVVIKDASKAGVPLCCCHVRKARGNVGVPDHLEHSGVSMGLACDVSSGAQMRPRPLPMLLLAAGPGVDRHFLHRADLSC